MCTCVCSRGCALLLTTVTSSAVMPHRSWQLMTMSLIEAGVVRQTHTSSVVTRLRYYWLDSPPPPPPWLLPFNCHFVEDCQVHKLNREDTMDHNRWKKLIGEWVSVSSGTGSPSTPRQRPQNGCCSISSFQVYRGQPVPPWFLEKNLWGLVKPGFMCRMSFLLPNCQCQSSEGNTKHWP